MDKPYQSTPLIGPEGLGREATPAVALRVFYFRRAQTIARLLPGIVAQQPRLFERHCDTILRSIILSYRFAATPPLALALQQTRSYRTLLLWCYALEEAGEAQAWPAIFERLQQRSPIDAAEDWARRVFSSHHLRDLEDLASTLLALQPSSVTSDELLQFAKVRLADRLAAKQKFAIAKQLLDSLRSDLGPQCEWLAMQELKALIFDYRSDKGPIEPLLEGLRLCSYLRPSLHPPLLVGLQHNFFANFLQLLHDPSRPLSLTHARRLLQQLGDAAWQERLSFVMGQLEQSFTRRSWRLVSNVEPDGLKLDRNYGFDASEHWLADALLTVKCIEMYQDRSELPILEQEGRRFLAGQQNFWEQRCRFQSVLVHMQGEGQAPALPASSVHVRPEAEWPRMREELRARAPVAALPLISLIEAGLAYRRGNFEACLDSLKRALTEHPERQLTQALRLWLQTAAGKATRPLADASYVTQLSRLVFGPSLEPLGEGEYRVSRHYQVTLTHYPVLNRLLLALLHQPVQNSQAAWLQTQVWGQATSLQGWKQKIRNTLQRLRTEFRWTLVPLIDQDPSYLRLNHKALSVLPPLHARKEERTREIIRLLNRHPLSSRQLAIKTKIPLATVKRILVRLLDRQELRVQQQGRAVLYAWVGQPPPSLKRSVETANRLEYPPPIC